MSTGIPTVAVHGVFEAITPFVGDSELWCHRTRVTEATDFWEGLRIPAIQAGLRSTATRLTDPVEFPSLEDAVGEFTTRWMEEDPMNNSRVFVVAPIEHNDILIPLDSKAPFQHKGLLPGKFVLAHLSLIDGQLRMNPLFDL